MDLRWQRADKPVGFYGLKNGVQMRSSEGPIDIDWDGFDKVDRHSAQQEYLEKVCDQTYILGHANLSRNKIPFKGKLAHKFTACY